MSVKRRKIKKRLKKKVVTSNYKPTRKTAKKKLFSAKFIKECKDKLLQKYKELTEIQKKNVGVLFEEVGDEVDIAVNVLGQEVQHELSDTQRSILDLISLALEKIEKGEYGICENCKQPIAKKRLEVLPWAKYCIKCQNNIEH